MAAGVVLAGVVVLVMAGSSWGVGVMGGWGAAQGGRPRGAQ
jgi:hypothetical protein